MPLNAAMRKGIGKKAGAMLQLKLQVDTKPYELNKEFMECLADEPKALDFFNPFPARYRITIAKWIESAQNRSYPNQTNCTCGYALSRKMHYGEMLDH
jgi:hypothetical protein